LTLADTGNFGLRYGAFDVTLSTADAAAGSALAPKELNDNHKRRSIFNAESILKQTSGLDDSRQNVEIYTSLIMDVDFSYIVKEIPAWRDQVYDRLPCFIRLYPGGTDHPQLFLVWTAFQGGIVQGDQSRKDSLTAGPLLRHS
jgi:hypothetical protein